MIDVKVDFHVHSITSLHAYNTIWECTTEAERKKMKAIAITNHFGPYFLSGSLFQHYASISQLSNLRRKINNIIVFPGVEIDIIDKKGNLAFEDTYFEFDKEKSVKQKLLEKMIIVIASYHEWGRIYGDVTGMLQRVLNNPDVDILGHCDRIHLPYDMKTVIKEAALNKKIVELNCKSLLSGEDAKKNFLKLATLCAEYKTMVSLGSDAHFLYEIGEFNTMIATLNSIHFPRDLILNYNWTKICKMPKIYKYLKKIQIIEGDDR